LDVHFPRIDAEQRTQRGAARAILETENLDAAADEGAEAADEERDAEE
jgi:hypothetical protein